MKLSKALNIVLVWSGITQYRIAKISGIDRSAFSKIVKGKGEHHAWTTIQKIANALEEVDPRAKAIFADLMFKPDDYEFNPGDYQFKPIRNAIEHTLHEIIQSYVDSFIESCQEDGLQHPDREVLIDKLKGIPSSQFTATLNQAIREANEDADE